MEPTTRFRGTKNAQIPIRNRLPRVPFVCIYLFFLRLYPSLRLSQISEVCDRAPVLNPNDKTHSRSQFSTATIIIIIIANRQYHHRHNNHGDSIIRTIRTPVDRRRTHSCAAAAIVCYLLLSSARSFVCCYLRSDNHAPILYTRTRGAHPPTIIAHTRTSAPDSHTDCASLISALHVYITLNCIRIALDVRRCRFSRIRRRDSDNSVFVFVINFFFIIFFIRFPRFGPKPSRYSSTHDARHPQLFPLSSEVSYNTIRLQQTPPRYVTTHRTASDFALSIVRCPTAGTYRKSVRTGSGATRGCHLSRVPMHAGLIVAVETMSVARWTF